MDDQRRFEYCFDLVKVDQGVYFVESNQDSNLNGKLIAQDGDGDWTIDCDWRGNGYRLVQLFRILVPKGYILPFGSDLLVNPANALRVVSRDEYVTTLEFTRRIYLRTNRSTH